MRCLLVGLIGLLLASTVWGQVKGQIESIGFQNQYRPDCWTPMVVSLRPETGENATYQIHIEQRDSDGDKVVFVYPVTVTGNLEGQSRDLKKEVYFLPQSTQTAGLENPGLAPPTDPGALKLLQEQLRVYITNESGRHITDASLSFTITPIDPPGPEQFNQRGTKLVLAVADLDSGSQPNYAEYEGIYGVNEDVRFVVVRPRELPENVIGYDAVDAVVFLNADPNELKTPTDERMRALRQWVREGGSLAICQPPQWEKTLGFGDLLPVTYPRRGAEGNYVQGVIDRPGNPPVYDLMLSSSASFLASDMRSIAHNRIIRSWASRKGPYRVSIADAASSVYVTHWTDWTLADNSTLRTPFIAKKTHGLGSVTWVGQDLGDPTVSVGTLGWPYVWDEVFGWSNRPWVPLYNKEGQIENHPPVQRYQKATGVDLGRSLLSGMEHGRKGAGLVFLVVFFFIAYWVVAGPASYLFLAGRKKTHLSWFAFATAATVATVLTAGVVELVLRGDPEVRHLSIVRLRENEPAFMQSRIGLYIPDDGVQEITAPDAAKGTASNIAPFAFHPQHATDVKFTAALSYQLPVPGMNDTDVPMARIPYRSTLKKLQTRWVGNTRSAITGQVTLGEGRNAIGRCTLIGKVSNLTPHDLRDVYLAFIDAQGVDSLCYIPTWGKGQTLDLQADVQWHPVGASSGNIKRARPGERVAIADELQTRTGRPSGWTLEYLLNGSWASMAQWNDADRGHSHSLPVLSLFNRISPVMNTQREMGRYEIVRRNGRDLDMSGAVAAGDLAVFAIADSTPLPMPFRVEGDAVDGQGTTIYQAVIALDRSKLTTTQPTTMESEPEPAPTPEVEAETPPPAQPRRVNRPTRNNVR